MEWIIHRCGEPIPDELYYPGWQTDRDNDKKTPLMIWIWWRTDETIPDNLFYDNCGADVDEKN